LLYGITRWNTRLPSILYTNEEVDRIMKFWQKLLVTVIAMLIASFAAGRLWLMAFDFLIPSYLAGMVGGLAGLPVWELLRRAGRIR
jgi:hypothetical protein